MSNDIPTPIVNPDPVDPTGQSYEVAGTAPSPDGGACPSCGSPTSKDHNGFDICSASGVPKEHCQKTHEEVGT